MRTITVMTAMLFLLLSPLWATAAEIYRYTDERGVIHVVADPADVPERYRAGARPVQGKVSRVSGGEAQPESPDLSAFSAFIPDFENLALPPWIIVLIEAWRSHVFVNLMILTVLFAMFGLGLIYARNIPGKGRGPMRVKLAVSFTLTLALFWLALMGPGLRNLLRGCERQAESNLEMAADNPSRERLERFRSLSERAAEEVERVIISPPT